MYIYISFSHFHERIEEWTLTRDCSSRLCFTIQWFGILNWLNAPHCEANVPCLLRYLLSWFIQPEKKVQPTLLGVHRESFTLETSKKINQEGAERCLWPVKSFSSIFVETFSLGARKSSSESCFVIMGRVKWKIRSEMKTDRTARERILFTWYPILLQLAVVFLVRFCLFFFFFYQCKMIRWLHF